MVCVLGDENRKSDIEKSIVSELNNYGINSVSSLDLLPLNQLNSQISINNYDKSIELKIKLKLLVKINQNNIDKLLFVLLGDSIEVTKRSVSWHRVHDDYSTHYNYGPRQILIYSGDPIYARWSDFDEQFEKTVFLTTYLLDAANGIQVWSAKTVSAHVYTIYDLANSYTPAIIEEMSDDGILLK